jgi:hypothetical protein
LIATHCQRQHFVGQQKYQLDISITVIMPMLLCYSGILDWKSHLEVDFVTYMLLFRLQ